MSISSISVARGSTNGNALMSSTALTAGATGTDGYACTGMARDERFGLIVTNSGSATGTLWIKESDYFAEKGQGTLNVTIGGSVTRLVGPLEGQRFMDKDGTLSIESGITGVIYAIEM